MTLTEEQILTLAPDEASKKSGKELSNAAKWVTKGANEQALWGEAQGSGSKPYQTQIDLVNIAFKCSCPSRKFPCKHGLGLMLFYAKQPAAFTVTNMPAWVSDWIGKRADKQEKAVAKEEKPVDAAAQAKRQQQRHQKVADGLTELHLWIKDIVRNGIISMPDKGFAWFENMAKRMVDAQAPGIANMIRVLSETNFFKEDWQTGFLNQLLNIFLTVEAYKNIGQLNEALQQDIRAIIGFTQSQDELKEQNGVTDTWLVLAKQTIEVDQITTERFWLYGSQTEKYALILQFIVRGQGGAITPTPGMFLQAELVFYPSVLPLRAILKRQINATVAPALKKLNNWAAVLETETNLSSQLPVRSERPYLIQQLKPVQYNQQWWLQDAEKNMVQLKTDQKVIWKLLSYSGGEALDMAVIGREDAYEPVGVWHNNNYQIL